MAFGTPVAGTRAYSTLNATSIGVPYPTGIAANDIVVLFIGMKPSTANGGTVTTPTGWTLRDSITGQGGYGSTLGADTGNTNLYVFTKDNVTGSEAGTLTVTLGTNNISWGLLVRVPGGGATSERYGTADGGRATAPTANVAFTDLLVNGTTPPNISAGDMVLFAMCCPTDAPAGGSFSAQTISSAGTTFATPVELAELFSATGNDISGYVAYASATAGSSTAAPTIGATVSGTVTNIRGPLILLSIRDTSQKLTPTRYDNTNNFFSPTISQAGGTQTLAPTRYDNANTFYTPTVTKGAVALTPTRYDNANTFYPAAITQTGAGQTLTPALYANTSVFYSAALAATRNIAPSRYNNVNVFYASSAASSAKILPGLYSNTGVFYPADVAAPKELAPPLYANASAFYSPTVSQVISVQVLYPDTYTNTNSFFTASTTLRSALLPALYENANSFFPLTASVQQFVAPPFYGNQNTFYAARVAIDQFIAAPLVSNTNTVYAADASSIYRLSSPPIASSNVLYGPAASVGPAFIVPSLFANQNKFYKQSIIWWGSQPIIPETWDGIADTPATWDDLPIVGETWTELSVTETTWDSV